MTTRVRALHVLIQAYYHHTLQVVLLRICHQLSSTQQCVSLPSSELSVASDFELDSFVVPKSQPRLVDRIPKAIVAMRAAWLRSP